MPKKLLCLLMSLAAIWIAAGSANAQTADTAADEDRQIYDTEFFLGVDSIQYAGNAILESVAVSADGRYALCFSDGRIHHVNLYHPSRGFEKRFTFYDSGAVSVSFDEADGSLMVFPFRRNVLIKIDDAGSFLDSFRNRDALEKAAETDAVKKFRVTCGGNTYSFSGKNIFSLKNQVFTVMDENGNLLFRYAPNHFRYIMQTVLWIAFAVFCIAAVRYTKRKRKDE